MWGWSAAVAGIVLLVFLNCTANAFVWDDEQFIVKNAYLTSWRYLPQLFTQNVVAGAGVVSNLYRPLQMATHFLDVQVWDYRPWAHHLSTVLIHTAASVAVFRLLASLCPPAPAALAALLFAIHPIQSEAVAYTCGRGDGLAILFICLTLLSVRRRPWWALAWAALGMLSKESVAIVPLLLWLYDRAAGRPLGWRRHLPFWLLSGAYVVIRLTVLNFKNFLNFYDQANILTEHLDARVWTYLTTLPKGLSLWLWPAGLHHERSWPVFTSPAAPQVWGSLAAVVLLLGAAAWAWRRGHRVAAVGLAWFLAATLPTSNLVVLINAIFYDHWFILPGLGLAMAAASGLTRAFSGGRSVRVLAGGLSIAVLAACAVLTVRANGIWRTPIRLYTHILQHEPDSAKICNNLAMAYADAGQLEQAIGLYQRSITLSDQFPQTHHNLANAYLQLGEEARAVEELQRAVALDPAFHHAWIKLGMIALHRRASEDAGQAFTRAIRAYPYDAQAYLGLAQAHLARGDVSAARSALQAGREALPDDPILRTALEQLGVPRAN